jgi:hypothetical protein
MAKASRRDRGEKGLIAAIILRWYNSVAEWLPDSAAIQRLPGGGDGGENAGGQRA